VTTDKVNRLLDGLHRQFLSASGNWPNLDSILITWPEDVEPPKPAQVPIDLIGHDCVPVGYTEATGFGFVAMLTGGQDLDTPACRYRSGRAGMLLFTFPMKDSNGRIVGIRLRLPSGRKLAIKDGKEGLFYPGDLQPGGRLLAAEGPTDTAALLDLGFSAVGRPSCNGGIRHVLQLVRRL
jgi:hypothetical protein